MSNDTDFQPVPTRAALALQQRQQTAKHEFKVYNFDKPKETTATTNEIHSKKRHKINDKDDDDDNEPRRIRNQSKQHNDDTEFDIKKARNEVLNFAIANERTIKNKKRMEIFKAIKLGAKPPKKPYKNYKELLAERKRLKEIREERWKYHQLGKNQTGAASVKCRNKSREEKKQKKRAPVSNIDKHYGVAKVNFKKKK